MMEEKTKTWQNSVVNRLYTDILPTHLKTVEDQQIYRNLALLFDLPEGGGPAASKALVFCELSFSPADSVP